MPFGIDIQCTCGHVRYVLLKDSQALPDSEDAKCPVCGSKEFTRCLGGNYHISNDPEVRSDMLKKRSYEHTLRTAKDNVERIVEKGRKKGQRMI